MVAAGDWILTHLDGHADELGQVLALLRAIGVERPEELAVSAGDRLLLELVTTLGEALEVAVVCASCGETNAITLTPDRAPPARARSAWWCPGGGLRQPTYSDLVELPPDATASVDELLTRCIVGAPSSPPSHADFERIDDTLTGPLAFACVECGAVVEADVDVERLVLEQLTRRAHSVDLDVHRLARAYQWELATIEALPDARRRRLASFVEAGW